MNWDDWLALWKNIPVSNVVQALRNLDERYGVGYVPTADEVIIEARRIQDA